MNTTPKGAFVSRIEREIADRCDLPLFGWRCTRGKGHEGSCAAVEAPEDISAVASAMDRLRKPAATQARASELSDAEIIQIAYDRLTGADDFETEVVAFVRAVLAANKGAA